VCFSCFVPVHGPLREDGTCTVNRVFCACFLLSLSMITLVVLSHHLGLMWVGMEATTLAMAPNIYFYHTPRSLEATWKYLLICSVGIALALLGSFFLAYATLGAGLESTLLFDDLVRQAPHLSRPWLQAAFVLVLVGSEPRWAWHRCTPGCRTLMEKHPHPFPRCFRSATAVRLPCHPADLPHL